MYVIEYHLCQYLQLLYYCIIIQLLYSIIIQYSSKNNAREIGKNHMSTTLNNNSSEESMFTSVLS